MPTDERLERVKKGETDLGLEALYFQFGRYLLIASSRPGGLPANLQGLWNDSMFPPWDSDYHLNINLQMNYWPAEVTNLAELHQPLFDYLESLREPGRKTARVHYGARGFVAHHITDVWGFTTPGDRPRSGLWPTGAAWLTQHLWEHYLFNPDRAFLARAYPGNEGGRGVLPRLPRRRSARARQARQRPVGVAGKSVSPAERPGRHPVDGAVDGSSDHHAACSRRCIRASEILGLDAEFRERTRRGAHENSASSHRQTRTDSGVGRRLRRAGSRASPHLAAVRAASGRSDYGARHAGPGEGGARHDRAPPCERRRPYGLEPRVDHQLLGAASGWRAGACELSGAAREVDAAEPVGSASAVSDRRQLRRHRGRCRDAAAEPRRRHPPVAGSAAGMGGRTLHRPARARRRDGGRALDGRKTDVCNPTSVGRGRSSASACRPAPRSPRFAQAISSWRSVNMPTAPSFGSSPAACTN